MIFQRDIISQLLFRPWHFKINEDIFIKFEWHDIQIKKINRKNLKGVASYFSTLVKMVISDPFSQQDSQVMEQTTTLLLFWMFYGVAKSWSKKWHLLSMKLSSHLKVFWIPYARQYNLRFAYFLPSFRSSFMYCDLRPYVWLVFKSSF